MVYGLMKQSGGHVKLYSEVGAGTTVKLYLPRALESEDVLVTMSPGEVTGGDETILVVEDDDEVREVAVTMLGELGYRVLKARDAASALAIVESGLPIDLIFTDVMMPGAMRSPELARKAKQRLPQVAVLFTSGYTRNAIVHGGRLDPGVELLGKPYTREALARKIRHVLANQAQRQATAQVERRLPARNALKGATVLLVEDDDLIRRTTAEMLREAGCELREARSAEEALKLLALDGVDVLLTDVGLPGLSGLELAQAARARRPDVCVVLASGDNAVSADAAFLRASLVVKPYTADILRQTIEKALQARKSALRPL
jgi:CheY-like chemotaxis protein